jgi:hypothetical protein
MIPLARAALLAIGRAARALVLPPTALVADIGFLLAHPAVLSSSATRRGEAGAFLARGASLAGCLALLVLVTASVALVACIVLFVLWTSVVAMLAPWALVA